jgi:hypothetical protein
MRWFGRILIKINSEILKVLLERLEGYNEVRFILKIIGFLFDILFECCE